MFYLDFGAIAVLLFFGAQLAIGLLGLRAGRQAALLSTGALIAVVLPFTSSVYGWINSSTPLTWVLLALVTIRLRSKTRLSPDVPDRLVATVSGSQPRSTDVIAIPHHTAAVASGTRPDSVPVHRSVTGPEIVHSHRT